MKLHLFFLSYFVSHDVFFFYFSTCDLILVCDELIICLSGWYWCNSFFKLFNFEFWGNRRKEAHQQALHWVLLLIAENKDSWVKAPIIAKHAIKCEPGRFYLHWIFRFLVCFNCIIPFWFFTAAVNACVNFKSPWSYLNPIAYLSLFCWHLLMWYHSQLSYLMAHGIMNIAQILGHAAWWQHVAVCVSKLDWKWKDKRLMISIIGMSGK